MGAICLPRSTPLRCVAAALLVGHTIVAVPRLHAQVRVRARAKQTLVIDHLMCKDLNANGRLDPYALGGN